MINPTPENSGASGKLEWETPELVVEMVATITESSFTSAADDGLGSGS